MVQRASGCPYIYASVPRCELPHLPRRVGTVRPDKGRLREQVVVVRAASAAAAPVRQLPHGRGSEAPAHKARSSWRGSDRTSGPACGARRGRAASRQAGTPPGLAGSNRGCGVSLARAMSSSGWVGGYDVARVSGVGETVAFIRDSGQAVESDSDRVPVLADQPDAGDAYALQAESLLDRSAQLEQRRREARAPGEEARAETRNPECTSGRGRPAG